MNKENEITIKVNPIHLKSKLFDGVDLGTLCPPHSVFSIQGIEAEPEAIEEALTIFEYETEEE